MFCEEIRVPGLPGEEDVTDGSVENYEMDWDVVDNGVSEDEMSRCRPGCPGSDTGTVRCTGNMPEQTDEDGYLIVQE